MASFDEYLQFAIHNSPILREKSFELKEKQLQTLKALYEVKDCISVLPTGYGKSVIFQILPWFAQCMRQKDKPMTVIVVCPLTSLMQDQVLALRKSGINACSVSITGTHGITFEETNDENSGDEGTSQQCTIECDVPFQQLQAGEFNLIYSHPEALMKTRFAKVLRSKVYQDTVCAVVIDEVHMISEWGEGFRPAFMKLGDLICVFENTLHLLLTATATPGSVKTLTKQMNFKNPVVISENVDRPNIFLETRTRLPNTKKFEKFDDLIEPLVTELGEKRISFPVTIMYVDNLEALGYFFQYTVYKLQDLGYEGEKIPQNRIFAQYHKDYPESMKKIIIQELTKLNPKLRLVFATVALGMGVNAPSVERIIHSRPPTTMEKYLQEIGRAGRLGQAATATMFYNQSDIAKNRKGMTEDMRKYCTNQGCLRLMLVNYFGFDSPVYSGDKLNCCSNCKTLVQKI
ncbi:uncharacterized protein LOC134248910 [Saccostrea cucullata]|uniref:uncharacterized protein LOC134248910 n=1 Tax=Saccostrea cuccullata TaxID=36930 RepID=UPI002ED302FB